MIKNMQYSYRIKRKVVSGRSRGRTLGFPTANLRFYERDSQFDGGVYVIYAKIGKKWCKGAAHVGLSKTFSGKNKKIEVFLIDCKQMMYGEEIEVKFIIKIRESKKFKNKNLLIAQIKRDCEMANNYIKK
jgi:riboflavin kinase/FMN adenylyltransferase